MELQLFTLLVLVLSASVNVYLYRKLKNYGRMINVWRTTARGLLTKLKSAQIENKSLRRQKDKSV